MLARPRALYRASMQNTVHRTSAVAELLLALAGCGGGSTAPSPIAAASPAPTPPSTSSLTVTPSAAAQTLTVPNTGGFTGSLTVGAFAAGTTGTMQITFLAGDAATLSSVRRDSASVRAPQAAGGPIFQTQISGGISGQVLITGYLLNTPSNLVFPNGTYQAVLSYNTLGTQGLTFVAQNGVLTLVTNGNPLIILPGQTLLLSVYAPGVTPGPTPSPSPSPSPSPAPGATPTPSPTPSPVPTPQTGGSISVAPGPCVNVGYAAGSLQYTAGAAVAVPLGSRLLYGWYSSQYQYPINVPPPTYSAAAPFRNTSFPVTASEATTASVTYAAYPMGGGQASDDEIIVFAFLLGPDGSITPVEGSDRQAIAATTEIAAGPTTCASLGF